MNGVDRGSETWKATKKFIHEQKEIAQGIINNPDTPENITNVNRGILIAYEDLIDFSQSNTPAIDTGDEHE